MDEMEQYWYDPETLEQFQQNATLATEIMFTNRPERVDCFFQLYRLCCKYPNNNNQQGQNNNAPNSVPHNNTEYAMRMQRHRKKVMKLYNHNTSFRVGREWDIVTAVRGEAGKLRHFILEYTSSVLQRETMTTTTDSSSSSSSSIKPSESTSTTQTSHESRTQSSSALTSSLKTTSATDTTVKARLERAADHKAALMAHISKCVSQPSQLIAHEMALALAETMPTHVDDQE
ncbi:hypothetical protein ACA910_008292 [Epithemia clementina (nom. ined.)]